jgi:hypothetical protein
LGGKRERKNKRQEKKVRCDKWKRGINTHRKREREREREREIK